MESVNVAARLQKASCNRKASGLIPEMAIICIRSCLCLEWQKLSHYLQYLQYIIYMYFVSQF